MADAATHRSRARRDRSRPVPTPRTLTPVAAQRHRPPQRRRSRPPAPVDRPRRTRRPTRRRRSPLHPRRAPRPRLPDRHPPEPRTRRSARVPRRTNPPRAPRGRAPLRARRETLGTVLPAHRTRMDHSRILGRSPRRVDLVPHDPRRPAPRTAARAMRQPRRRQGVDARHADTDPDRVDHDGRHSGRGSRARRRRHPDPGHRQEPGPVGRRLLAGHVRRRRHARHVRRSPVDRTDTPDPLADVTRAPAARRRRLVGVACSSRRRACPNGQHRRHGRRRTDRRTRAAVRDPAHGTAQPARRCPAYRSVLAGRVARRRPHERVDDHCRTGRRRRRSRAAHRRRVRTAPTAGPPLGGMGAAVPRPQVRRRRSARVRPRPPHPTDPLRRVVVPGLPGRHRRPANRATRPAACARRARQETHPGRVPARVHGATMGAAARAVRQRRHRPHLPWRPVSVSVDHDDQQHTCRRHRRADSLSRHPDPPHSTTSPHRRPRLRHRSPDRHTPHRLPVPAATKGRQLAPTAVPPTETRRVDRADPDSADSVHRRRPHVIAVSRRPGDDPNPQHIDVPARHGARRPAAPARRHDVRRRRTGRRGRQGVSGRRAAHHGRDAPRVPDRRRGLHRRDWAAPRLAEGPDPHSVRRDDRRYGNGPGDPRREARRGPARPDPARRPGGLERHRGDDPQERDHAHRNDHPRRRRRRSDRVRAEPDPRRLDDGPPARRPRRVPRDPQGRRPDPADRRARDRRRRVRRRRQTPLEDRRRRPDVVRPGARRIAAAAQR